MDDVAAQVVEELGEQSGLQVLGRRLAREARGARVGVGYEVVGLLSWWLVWWFFRQG